MSGFASKSLLSAPAYSAAASALSAAAPALSAASAADGSIYFSSCGEADVPTEYDSHIRKTRVYLFERTVDQFPDAEEDHLKRRALFFYFVQDSSLRTAGGNCDDDNQIRAYYTKEAPRYIGRYYLLGEVEISPQDLREKVVNNPCNGQPYTAGRGKYCKKWVKCLAKSLGSSIAEQLRNYKSLKEANPFRAEGLSTSNKKRRSFFNMFKSSC